MGVRPGFYRVDQKTPSYIQFKVPRGAEERKAQTLYGRTYFKPSPQRTLTDKILKNTGSQLKKKSLNTK